MLLRRASILHSSRRIMFVLYPNLNIKGECAKKGYYNHLKPLLRNKFRRYIDRVIHLYDVYIVYTYFNVNVKYYLLYTYISVASPVTNAIRYYQPCKFDMLRNNNNLIQKKYVKINTMSVIVSSNISTINIIGYMKIYERWKLFEDL